MLGIKVSGTSLKEWIDESDVYMLIIGGRYGSIEPKSGRSYTHLEYEYALSVKKPHFVLIIDDETTQNKAKKDGVKITNFFDNSSDLKEFKSSVMKGKLVSICENSDRMESSIHKSINKLSQRENLKGWVKADDPDYSSISEELARLSKENSELKSQLDSQNISTIAQVVEFLSCEGASDRYEIIRGFEVVTLFDYFLTCAYNEDIKAMAGSLNPAQDLHKLQAIGLLESKTRNLSEKGKEVFLHLEINNVEIQEKPEI